MTHRERNTKNKERIVNVYISCYCFHFISADIYGDRNNYPSFHYGKSKSKTCLREKTFQNTDCGVIGVVVSFASNGLLNPDKPPFITKQMLTNSHWDWSLSEKSWRTDITFEQQNGSLSLKGITYCYKTGKEIPVIEWRSIEPISIPPLGKEIEFRSKMTYLEGIKEVDTTLKYEVGKWRFGRTKLGTDIALRGDFKPDSTKAWGILASRSWQ